MGWWDGVFRRLSAISDLRKRVVPNAVRRSLVTKTLLALVVVLLFVGTTGGVFYQMISTDLDQQVDRQIESTVSNQAVIYDEWLVDRRDEVRGTRSLGLLGLSDPEEISAALTEERRASNDIEQYHYVSTETGEILASSDERMIGKHTGEFGIEPDDLDQRWLLTQFDPPEGAHGESIAIGRAGTFVAVDRMILAEIRIADSAPTLEQPIPGATTTLFGPDGSPLFGPPVAVVDPDRPEDVVVLENETHLIAMTTLERNNDYVAAFQVPKERAFDLREAVLRSFVASSFMTFLVLITATLVLGRPTLRDIRVLAARAHQMGNGELNVELQTDRTDEIGTLYSSFDQMRNKLQSRIEASERSREQAEQFNEQLRVLDRLLRHNLNNDLNSIILYADMIQRQQEGEVAEFAGKIAEQGNSLIEKADKQRKITNLLSAEQAPVCLDIDDLLTEIVTEIRETHPNADISLETEDRATAEVLVWIHEAFEELLENAVVHTGSDPVVSITVTVHPESVRVRIADNGPGMPHSEKQTLTGKQTGKPLEHSNGIGLWLVYWTVKRSGGSIRVKNEGGATILVDLPRPDGIDSS